MRKRGHKMNETKEYKQKVKRAKPYNPDTLEEFISFLREYCDINKSCSLNSNILSGWSGFAQMKREEKKTQNIANKKLREENQKIRIAKREEKNKQREEKIKQKILILQEKIKN
jgi:predicted O-linked N-acetylglucosamine transferase (SPINDLY family)